MLNTLVKDEIKEAERIQFDIFMGETTEEQAKERYKITNLDSAKNAIQADFIAVSAKADSLTQQNTELQGDLLAKSNDIQKLKSNISGILRKKNATDKELAERKVAREILTMIEEICFSEEYKTYRLDYGTHGQRDLIITKIKEKYLN